MVGSGLKGGAKFGDVGLDAGGDVAALEKGVGADVDVVFGGERFFAGEGRAEVENGVGLEIDGADLLRCGCAACIGKDVGKNGPMDSFG